MEWNSEVFTAFRDRFFLPSDSPPVTEAEFLRAASIHAAAWTLIEQRDDFITRHEIDREFALPAANWEPGAALNLTRRSALTAGTREGLHQLRLLSCVYSGCDFVALVTAPDKTGAPRFSTGDIVLPADADPGDSSRAQFLNDEKIALVLLEKQNFWARVWEVMTKGLPEENILSLPRRFSEVGLNVNGVIVNTDTVAYQERICMLFHGGVIDHLERLVAKRGRLSILEIGGGFGALAHWIIGRFPNVDYTILDLPESLVFSSLFLTTAHPDRPHGFDLDPVPNGLRFTPNYMGELLHERFDLVINTLSMSEMSKYQVFRYAYLIRDVWLADDGLFFEQNQDLRHTGLNFAREILADVLPFRTPLTLPEAYGYALQGDASIWSLSPPDLTGRG